MTVMPWKQYKTSTQIVGPTLASLTKLAQDISVRWPSVGPTCWDNICCVNDEMNSCFGVPTSDQH